MEHVYSVPSAKTTEQEFHNSVPITYVRYPWWVKDIWFVILKDKVESDLQKVQSLNAKLCRKKLAASVINRLPHKIIFREKFGYQNFWSKEA